MNPRKKRPQRRIPDGKKGEVQYSEKNLIFFKKGIDISKKIVYNKIRREGTLGDSRDGYARVAELVDAHV